MGGRGNFSGGTIRTTANKLPTKGNPNSKIKQYRNGKLHRERYFDSDSRAKWDIDYSHGGNHKFPWNWSDPENPKRSEYHED